MIFQKILPACEEGSAEAWRYFLRNYTPTALQVLAVYTPWPADACWPVWVDALQALSAGDCAVLKSFSHQSEREFLVELRAFVQDFALARSQPSLEPRDAQAPPAPVVETLSNLLDGLPLLHQEIAFLALAGYSQPAIERILRITPAVAGEGLSRLRAGYAVALERTGDRCLWPAAWLGIVQTARANAQKDCVPLRQLIRILDGQASWYDKSPAESHRAHCLHCLELWTSLLEVVAWDRIRQPVPTDRIQAMLAVVPSKPEKRHSSMLGRMLGR